MPDTAAGGGTRGRGIVLALVSAAGFSTLGLFARFLYAEGFSVEQTLAWRFTAAALALWIWLFARGGWRRSLGEYRRACLLGLFGFAPQAGLYFLTLRYLKPGIAGLLLYLYPAFVVLFSFLFLRKKPGGAQILALALSALGCAITLYEPGEYPAVGLALGVLVALAYSAYLVAGEKVLEGLDPIFATACLMACSAVVYWITTAVSGSARLPSSALSLAGIAGVSLIASVLPIATLFASIKAIGASDASLVSTVEPVLTIVLSALFAGERMSPNALAGGALILAAVLALDLAGRKAKKPDRG